MKQAVLAQPILWLWKLRWYVPLKCRSIFTGLYNIISLEIELFSNIFWLCHISRVLSCKNLYFQNFSWQTASAASTMFHRFYIIKGWLCYTLLNSFMSCSFLHLVLGYENIFLFFQIHHHNWIFIFLGPKVNWLRIMFWSTLTLKIENLKYRDCHCKLCTQWQILHLWRNTVPPTPF